jgi:pimeloyl-ACP methyl ester carboxylesterase
VQIERRRAGTVPYATTDSGDPLVVLAGLWPTTGVDSDRLVRGALAPLRRVAASRRLVVFNRRANLPTGVSMSDLAAEYADAIGAEFGGPVDVMGTSTGGSIAQQLAAEHPQAVRRLVLLSTACRLGPVGREVQRQVAVHLRRGDLRSAMSLVAGNLAPLGFRTVARALAWTAAPRVIADARTAADLAATLEAEDGFDLARCEQPIQATTLISPEDVTASTAATCSPRPPRSFRTAACISSRGVAMSPSPVTPAPKR